ncbi:hypothetical protein JVT61DRAFT_15148 [Boletus reticuloceps]|uniref:Uncharacterized protein n=1 Tax=Boletus reticuloceps TaxID=495285 RepID=A0A8I2YSM7_9AGAM|nr:hypothetical protein JVT61DRAFT_15148 [Boletus reticuloceps]
MSLDHFPCSQNVVSTTPTGPLTPPTITSSHPLRRGPTLPDPLPMPSPPSPTRCRPLGTLLSTLLGPLRPSPTPPLRLLRRPPFTLFHQTDYPQSSSRPLIHHSIASPTASSTRSVHNTLSSMTTNPKYDSHTWGDGLYTIDDPETASNSERPASSVATSPSARASSISSSTSFPPVKVEPEDSVASDCFVMEFSASTPAAQASSSLAPPTEVPLRATQASKAMRKMMGVFRLNPFSMHESGAQPTTTWTGEEAGPLEEEPQMFEFQLDLPGYDRASSDPVQPQPTSSNRNRPDGDFDDTGNWAECNEQSLQYPPTSHPAWLGNDSPASYTLPSLRPYSPHPPLHSPSPSVVSQRRTPSDNPSSDYASPYTLPVPSSCATSIDNLPPISTMARRWTNTTNLQHPFMI